MMVQTQARSRAWSTTAALRAATVMMSRSVSSGICVGRNARTERREVIASSTITVSSAS